MVPTLEAALGGTLPTEGRNHHPAGDPVRMLHHHHHHLLRGGDAVTAVVTGVGWVLSSVSASVEEWGVAGVTGAAGVVGLIMLVLRLAAASRTQEAQTARYEAMLDERDRELAAAHERERDLRAELNRPFLRSDVRADNPER